MNDSNETLIIARHCVGWRQFDRTGVQSLGCKYTGTTTLKPGFQPQRKVLGLPVVRIANITKTYGHHTAVSNLSLDVPGGSLYGFIGPNGSGKTTTIRMILRIIYPDRGEIEVLGSLAASAANDRLGYLPEERGLYKKLSVRRMLLYYAALKGMSRGDANAAIEDWLERFELTSWSSKKIETLSKGMSQKVQFIASVISKTESADLG